MAEITDSVGAGGRNHGHDVVLVQMMLKVISRSGGRSYFGGDYTQTNTKNGQLAAAIGAFQQAHNLIPPPQKGTVVEKTDRLGLVEPGSQTWKKLVTSLPGEYRAARTLEGTSLAYFPMREAIKDQSINELRAHELDPDFKEKLIALVTRFHAKSGIALFVNDTGWRRTLKDQIGKKSEAAPGETIHHYGLAVDIGFKDLTYVAMDGSIQTTATHKRGFEGFENRHKEQFFAARNKIAVDQLGLHPTIFGGDLFHLQAYDDGRLDSVTSFIALLETVGKRMSWGPQYMTPTDYWCDLGLGGERFLVGTALEIWHPDKHLALSRSDLARALNAKLAADPKFSVEGYLGVAVPALKAASAPGAAPRQLTGADLNDTHIAAVKRLLQAEFIAAEKAWRKWQPKFYRSAARRGKNPRFARQDRP